MTKIQKQNFAEWLLVAVMFVLCAALTVLQYRWTGDVARAEKTQLRDALGDQSRAIATAFDAELTQSCGELLPDDEEFAGRTIEATYLARFNAWKARNPRPIFRRIALGSVVGNRVQLAVLEPDSRQFVHTNWPAEWSMLQENLNDKITDGSPPYRDPRGVLVEFPVFGGDPGRGHEHWLITELDVDYARSVWFPELVAKYLSNHGKQFNEARVKTGNVVLFATDTNATPVGDKVVSVRFNRSGKTEKNSRGPMPQNGSWTLETWQPPGALETAVAGSRRKNLAVALLISVLMFATGIALLRQTRRARRLAEQQMNFVAGVSHELRTPLTVIRGAAHNMKRGVVTERSQVELYAGLIVDHCEQLTGMIEGVLTLAGAQKGQSASVRQPVALADVLNEAVAATAHDAQVARCVVQVELPPTLPTIMGDAGALRRVFQNLITNAAKHGGEGRWIGVTAITDEENAPPMVEVQVADRGPGITPGEEKEIFKPFFRGEAARTKQVRGSGLGLSLVKEIVEVHGGTISVRNNNGQGAMFTVRLPLAAKEHA